MTPDAFAYDLPPDRIAQRPADVRTQARMLVLDPGVGSVDARVDQLPRLLPSGALVVVNASAVVPARLRARRADGKTFELLVCHPAAAMTSGARVAAWVRGARRLRSGDVVGCGDLELRYLGPDPIDPRARGFEVLAGDVLTTCQRHGEIPLPPYIGRQTGPTSQDVERYQTIFARQQGSIAAPTAGLHFDRDLLAALDVVSITLHVGPGTFLPLEAEDVRQHRVGAERVSVSADAAARIEEARRADRPIVAVGTTVTRALETLGRGGAPIEAFDGATDLVITPGFEFQVVTHLLTNFHLPRSSLLMLVCAFAGRSEVLSAYAHAVDSGYRFYSYGDCMLCSRA